MNPTFNLLIRPVVRGKFFFVGEEKFFVQGVTYGPFRPAGNDGAFFKSPEETRRDFQLIRAAGFNVLRVYHQPPAWFLDLAAEHALYTLITIPWKKRVLFLDSAKTQKEIRSDLQKAAQACAGRSAVLGFYVDNELPPDLVRWYGPHRVEQFLDSLVRSVKEEDPGVLCAYANFPPTEYLLPKAVDFYSYNVYLHDPARLKAYLSRLQNLAEEKPLVLGEFGMDTIRHSEDEQADLLKAHYNTVFRAGLAGTIVFSWTDEWFTDGVEVDDWAFGLVKRDRTPKKVYHCLKDLTLPNGGAVQDRFPLSRYPMVSVVVCSYNGSLTLRACLESVRRLRYPNYEVILVDDGSHDNTQEIMQDFPEIKNICQPNKGLSVARNVGTEAAKGEIVAFTDSDCMADRDWLYYLVQTLLESNFVAVGGPNISPPAADSIQAAVAASPGAPRHVLLNDTEAEHIPGCNMAFYRWALKLVEGFDPQFRAAGDDVDLCWRLMQMGHKIGFSPSAVVWHHRRFTMRAYFKQQQGYGKAEAMLRYKHLHYFDSFGSARWKGVIYGQSHFERVFQRPIIYHGIFGTGLFQCIYPPPHSEWFSMVSSLEWFGFGLFIFLVSYWVDFLRVIPLLMLGFFLLPAFSYMIRARIESNRDTVLARLFVFYLATMQPLVRGWARYFTWFQSKQMPAAGKHPRQTSLWRSSHLAFWSERGGERDDLLRELVQLLEKGDWLFTCDTGWGNWDIVVFANRWWRVRMKTLTEIYPHGRRLTRVENSPVLRKFGGLAAFCLLTAATLITIAFPHAWPVVLAALFVMALTAWFTSLFVCRRLAELICAAAARSNLTFVARP
ncbi:MAG: glycosyltransferase [bacterium]